MGAASPSAVHPYVQLATDAIDSYVRDFRVITPPAGLFERHPARAAASRYRGDRLGGRADGGCTEERRHRRAGAGRVVSLPSRALLLTTLIVKRYSLIVKVLTV